MGRIELQVRIDPDHSQELDQPTVAFGRFTSKRPDVIVYQHDELSKFFVDLICGRPLPTSLLLGRFSTLADLLKIVFFLDREVVLHPKAPVLISSVELAQSLKEGGLAHVERDLARFLLFLEAYFAGYSTLDKREQGRRLQEASGWIRSYVLQDRLPNLPSERPPPSILDVGSRGFVVAKTLGSLSDGLIELYRLGHLRGVLFLPRGSVVAFRKTPYLRFDLSQAMQKLNQAEQVMGDPPTWRLDPESCLLRSPPKGSRLPPEDITKLLLSV